jgi:hypothetical protein
MTTHACVADGFRYGRWKAAEANGPSSAASLLTCGNLTYANATCTPEALSIATLCEALRGTELLLMVGDSLMLKMWETLLEVQRLSSGKQGRAFRFEAEDCRAPRPTRPTRGKLACYPCCCKAFSLPCRRPVRVRFVRHNHLLGDFLPHGGSHCPKCALRPTEAACLSCRRALATRTLCNVWRDDATLQLSTTLVVGTGSHVLEVPHYNESGVFAHRADDLGAMLAAQASRPPRVVFLLATWGEQHYTSGFVGARPPRPPHATYAWDRVPSVNAEYARAMRAHGFVVVDSTLAMSMRRDCRLDYMHSTHGVYAQSTWRMLQAALAALPAPSQDGKRALVS